jgi:hypothetical protein
MTQAGNAGLFFWRFHIAATELPHHAAKIAERPCAVCAIFAEKLELSFWISSCQQNKISVFSMTYTTSPAAVRFWHAPCLL